LGVALCREEVAVRVVTVAASRRWRPVMVLAIGGPDMPTRPQAAKGRRPWGKKAPAERARWSAEWWEAKGFRFYVTADERIVRVLGWHQAQTDGELAPALLQV
jgi:hypothetical protein